MKFEFWTQVEYTWIAKNYTELEDNLDSTIWYYMMQQITLFTILFSLKKKLKTHIFSGFIFII